MSLRADFLVIGGGIAGLRAAIDLVGHGRVLLLTKAVRHREQHRLRAGRHRGCRRPGRLAVAALADTLDAGAGLCDREAVAALVTDGPRYVQELIDWGAAFERDADGRLALGREGAHSVRRVLHAHDATGREITRTLHAQARRRTGVRDLRSRARDEPADRARPVLRCAGPRHRSPAGVDLGARGAARDRRRGPRFQETTNPAIATGDGLAMAWRAGARLGDLEFVQFHPTVAARARPAALSRLGGGARRGRAPAERRRRALHEPLRPARRSRAARRRRDRDGARSRPHRAIGLSVAAAPGRGLGARALSRHRRRVPRGRARSRAPTCCPSARRRTTCAAAWTPISPGARRCQACSPPARSRARACTAPTGSPATRCSRGSCSVRARRRRCRRRAAAAGDLPETPRDRTDADRGRRRRQCDARRAGPDVARRRPGARARGPRPRGLAPRGHRRAAAKPPSRRATGLADAWRRANLARVGALIARAALWREESRGGHRRADFPERRRSTLEDSWKCEVRSASAK